MAHILSFRQIFQFCRVLSLVSGLNQITIKTPKPKCRLDWFLIEFIDWRYTQSCWYFKLLLWTSAPITFSLVHLPSLPVWISTGVCIYTVCNTGGRDRVVWRAYTGVIHCVFDQIPNLQNCFTTPNKNLGGKGGFRQVNTFRQVHLQVIFKKSRHLGLESLSYLVHGLAYTYGHALEEAVNWEGEDHQESSDRGQDCSRPLKTKRLKVRRVAFTGRLRSRASTPVVPGFDSRYIMFFETELVFLNPYGAQESMPRHQFRQPM